MNTPQDSLEEWSAQTPHESPLLVTYDGPVAVLRLNRPAKRNAINAALAGAMRQACAAIIERAAGEGGRDAPARAATTRVEREAAGAAVRAVLLTGSADCFCAGMDLQAFLHGEGPAINDGDGRFAGFTDHRLPVPVIAAVEGPALAGGFELVLACDMVVAGEGAVFGLPEVKVGLFPAAGGAFRLPRKLPPALAMELVCTGARLSAATAWQYGLVNRLVSDGTAFGAALELAQGIAAQAPLGVRAGLALARQAIAQEAALWETNDSLWQKVAASADAAEGPSAFLEKRSPVWRGE